MSDLIGLSLFGAWLAWSATWAFVLRVGLSVLAVRLLPTAPRWARAFSAYGAMVAILIGSGFIHTAVLGEPNLYGATPRQEFSLLAYFLAPFGVPLVIGGLIVLVSDALFGPFELTTRSSRRSAR